MSADRPLLYGIPRPPETGASLAAIGFGMFTRASIRCPASVTAQGVHIAIENISLGLDLNRVRNDFLENPKYIAASIKAAEEAHQKGGVIVEDIPAQIPEIISNDFYFANKFGVLPPYTLQSIIIRFDNLRRRNAPLSEIEGVVSDFAYDRYYKFIFKH